MPAAEKSGIGGRAAADFVILSSVHFHFTWQRHQEIAAGLAARGHRVQFVEPIPKRWPRVTEMGRVVARLGGRSVEAGSVGQQVPAGVELYNLRALPDVGPASRWINRRWFVPRAAKELERRLGPPRRRTRVVWHYLPLPAAIELAERLAPDLEVYDCVWDWARDPYSAPGVTCEERLVDRVDAVFADSPFLTERLRARHPRVHRLMPGVDPARWEPARTVRERSSRPQCAYFGAIGANLDLELLEAVAAEFPLRLIGPVQVELGRALGETAELVGAVPAAEVAALLADVDVLVLPYRRGGHVRGVLPAKTFECLATGKPVVTSGLDSLEEFGEAFARAEGAEAFVARVREVAGDPVASREERLELARRQDWAQRIDAVEAVVADLLGERS